MDASPLGINMPSGVDAEILGIRLGESFTEACAKLSAYTSQKIAVPISTYQIRTGQGAQQSLKLTFPAGLQYQDFQTTQNGKSYSSEKVGLIFSSPASHSQMIAAYRILGFYNLKQQPLIADFVKQLTEKFQSEPEVFPYGSLVYYEWVFDGGNRSSSGRPAQGWCSVYTAGGVRTPADMENFNENGKCDIFVQVTFQYGFSQEHAIEVRIDIADIQRIRENGTTDFKALDTYQQSLQGNGVAAPKL